MHDALKKQIVDAISKRDGQLSCAVCHTALNALLKLPKVFLDKNNQYQVAHYSCVVSRSELYRDPRRVSGERVRCTVLTRAGVTCGNLYLKREGVDMCQTCRRSFHAQRVQQLNSRSRAV